MLRVTSKSPRKVLKLAHTLGEEVLPRYFSRFSRHDGFTKPQLFACLVLREHQRKSFRVVEAMLADSPQWLADIGLSKAPDHNTLSRAIKEFVDPDLADSMLDLMAKLAKSRKLLRGDGLKPLTLDSSMFESRHVSRHFEHRQTGHRRRRWAANAPQKRGALWGPRVNRRRGRVVRRLPKLSLAVDAAPHVVLAAVASTGAGGDQPFLDGLLYHAWRRTRGRVRCVVADASYDSEDNHRSRGGTWACGRSSRPSRAGRRRSPRPSRCGGACTTGSSARPTRGRTASGRARRPTR
jgi:hypothetical protein